MAEGMYGDVGEYGPVEVPSWLGVEGDLQGVWAALLEVVMEGGLRGAWVDPLPIHLVEGQRC